MSPGRARTKPGAPSALEAAVRLLAARGRSRARLQALLAQRGFQAGEIDAALARVAELGYLDEAAQGRDRAARLAASGWADVAVLARLEGEGLDAGRARACLAAALADGAPGERERAVALLRRRRLRGARAARLLASRGYPLDLAAELAGLAPAD